MCYNLNEIKNKFHDEKTVYEKWNSKLILATEDENQKSKMLIEINNIYKKLAKAKNEESRLDFIADLFYRYKQLNKFIDNNKIVLQKAKPINHINFFDK